MFSYYIDTVEYDFIESVVTCRDMTEIDFLSEYKKWIIKDIRDTLQSIIKTYDGKVTRDTLMWGVYVAYINNGIHSFSNKFYNYLSDMYSSEIRKILDTYNPFKRFVEENISLEDYLSHFLKENGGRQFEILAGLLFTLYDIPCPCCGKVKTVHYLGGIHNPVDFFCSSCHTYIELKAKMNKGFESFKYLKRINFGSYWNFRPKNYYVLVINQEEGKNFCKCVKAKCVSYGMRFVSETFTRKQVKSIVHVSDIEDYPELEKLVKANIKNSLSKLEIQKIVDKIIKEELETQSSLQNSLSRLKLI